MNNLKNASALPLVSCKWLAERLASKTPNLRVLDGSWHLPMMNRDPRKEYAESHIPGALFFDLEECSDQSSKFEHMLPPVEQFISYVEARGISNNTHVVVYDNNEKFGFLSAMRIWWTFKIFGHNSVSVLDGGFPKWTAEGHSVTDKLDNVDKQVFKAKLNLSLLKSLEDLEKNIEANNRHFNLIDARPAGRFQGTMPEPRPDIKPGHIAGSTNIPFLSMIDPNTKLMKTPKELKNVFSAAGVDLDKPLVASCGSGVSACVLAYGAYLCGKEDVAIYDGAWVEWYQRGRKENKIAVPEN